MPQSSPDLDPSQHPSTPPPAPPPNRPAEGLVPFLNALGYSFVNSRPFAKNLLDHFDGDEQAAITFVQRLIDRGWVKTTLSDVIGSDPLLRNAGIERLFELQDALELGCQISRPTSVQLIGKHRSLVRLSSDELLEKIDAAIVSREPEAVMRLITHALRVLTKFSLQRIMRQRTRLLENNEDPKKNPGLLLADDPMDDDDAGSGKTLLRLAPPDTILKIQKHLSETKRHRDFDHDVVFRTLAAASTELELDPEEYEEAITEAMERVTQERAELRTTALGFGDTSFEFVLTQSIRQRERLFLEGMYRVQRTDIQEAVSFLHNQLNVRADRITDWLRKNIEVLWNHAQPLSIVQGFITRCGQKTDTALKLLSQPRERTVLFEDPATFDFIGRITAVRRMDVDEKYLKLAVKDLDVINAWSRLYMPLPELTRRLKKLPASVGSKKKEEAITLLFVSEHRMFERGLEDLRS